MATSYSRHLPGRRREGFGPPFHCRSWIYTVQRVLPHWDRDGWAAQTIGRPILIMGYPGSNQYRKPVRQQLFDRRHETLWPRIPACRDDTIFAISRFHHRVLKIGPWNPHPCQTWAKLDRDATGVEGIIRIWSVHPQVSPPYAEYFEGFATDRRDPDFRVFLFDDPLPADVRSPAAAKRQAAAVV
ncbi:hypothetical protein JL100_010295 [Skermanella mucosa]|uniref:hypothetical protein n=1 Tax=Skermanella mucosa TaxID=1789672 RepID=UPI00192B90E4|nr:hypothetical protein [Skermanella mucosa]UEM23104.1 hypothetical protein JL100_010295 [Skermanella mucosa]